jgi:hypothetical protein
MTGLAERYAVCEGVLRQKSFADDVAMVAAAGIAGIGVDANVVDGVGAEEARRVLVGEGVGVSSYMDLATILHEGGAPPRSKTPFGGWTSPPPLVRRRRSSRRDR